MFLEKWWLPFFLLLLPLCMSSQSLSARMQRWCSYTHQAPQKQWEKQLDDTSPFVGTLGRKPNRFQNQINCKQHKLLIVASLSRLIKHTPCQTETFYQSASQRYSELPPLPFSGHCR